MTKVAKSPSKHSDLLSADERKKLAEDAKVEMEQVKMLFEYTKFHIGLYTTIATAFGAILAFQAKSGNENLLKLQPWELFFIVLSFVSICLAGLAGGVITSSLTQFTTLHGDHGFLQRPIGPGSDKWKFFAKFWRRGESWTFFEHSSFWVAMILAAIVVIVRAACQLPWSKFF